MADAVLTRDGPVSVPLDYVVPQGGELAPLTVRAVLDGTSASGPFYGIVEVISPSGRSMGKYRSDAIAAGGSADITWFPGAELEEEAAGPSQGVIVESLFLDSKASVPVSSSTVLQSGRPYVITVQGTYTEWNANLTLGTPNADAMFPSSTAGRVSTEVGIDAECCFARDPGPSAFEVGQHTTCFQMNLGSGMQHVEPVGGPYNTPQPNYFYTYNVTGQGSVASFLTAFTPQTDNYGKLLITIQTVGGGSSGGGGGSLLPDPTQEPDGAWLRTTSGTAIWRATPQVTETDMSLSDVTTQNVSTSKHGFAPKAPNDATKFLDGTGAYSTPSGSSGVTSLDGITGAVTLTAGSNVTITDNSPSAGQITIAATPGAGGFQVVDYVEFTVAVSITATTEGTAQTVVTGAGFTADGTSNYLIEFFSPASHPTSTASASLSVVLFEGSTSLGHDTLTTPSNNTMNVPVYMARRLIPSAGSHTYKVAAFVSGGTGVVGAGTGGSNSLAGYIMVTKQI